MKERTATNQGASLRVFVAIHPPEAVMGRLKSVLAHLQEALPRRSVRWARADAIHLTLRFLGDVPTIDVPTMKDALADAVRGTPSFTLRLAAPGCFPNARAPRVLWIGLAGELDSLSALQARVESATRRWGKPEARDFHPHLTLGRVATHRRDELQTISTAMNGLPVPATDPWPITGLHLMRSDLKPSGAVYTSLAQFSLAS